MNVCVLNFQAVLAVTGIRRKDAAIGKAFSDRALFTARLRSVLGRSCGNRSRPQLVV
jgi:hypothetical protein